MSEYEDLPDTLLPTTAQPSTLQVTRDDEMVTTESTKFSLITLLTTVDELDAQISNHTQQDRTGFKTFVGSMQALARSLVDLLNETEVPQDQIGKTRANAANLSLQRLKEATKSLPAEFRKEDLCFVEMQDAVVLPLLYELADDSSRGFFPWDKGLKTEEELALFLQPRRELSDVLETLLDDYDYDEDNPDKWDSSHLRDAMPKVNQAWKQLFSPPSSTPGPTLGPKQETESLRATSHTASDQVEE